MRGKNKIYRPSISLHHDTGDSGIFEEQGKVDLCQLPGEKAKFGLRMA